MKTRLKMKLKEDPQMKLITGTQKGRLSGAWKQTTLEHLIFDFNWQKKEEKKNIQTKKRWIKIKNNNRRKKGDYGSVQKDK